MEAAVVFLLILGTWGIGWTVNWAMVRFIIIPSVFAAWDVALPFWPIMGLLIVAEIIFGGGVRATTKRN